MFTLISFALVAIFILLCGRSLRVHPVPYTIAAAVFAIATFIIQLTRVSAGFPAFAGDYIWPLFFRGGIAGAIFAVVMWAGAVPADSRMVKRIIPIRGELSVMACILSMGHGAANGLIYFRQMFTRPERMSAVTIAFCWVSIAMIIVMLPLFITSFRSIHRKMKGSSWKKLQRLAYIFYALTFAHVSLLYIPYLRTRHDYWISYMVYCTVFICYTICRILKAAIKRNNSGLRKMQIAGNAAAIIIIALAAIFIMVNTNAPVYAVADVQVQSAAGSEPASQIKEAESESGNVVKEPESLITKVGQEPSSTSGKVESEEPSQEIASAKTEPSAEETAYRKYNDGTYYGSGEGYEGTISVSVTIEDDRIVWIEPGENIEDPEFYIPALAVLEQVLNRQNTDIDAVSGSTYSSYGLLDAVDDALARARR